MNNDIINKIKTYQDACDYLDINPDNHIFVDNESYLKSFIKLTHIVKALNEGEILNPTCGKIRHKPYLWIKNNKYHACVSTYGSEACSTATANYNLYFKSVEACQYCLKQFWPLWKDYFGYKEDLELVIV